MTDKKQVSITLPSMSLKRALEEVGEIWAVFSVIMFIGFSIFNAYVFFAKDPHFGLGTTFGFYGLHWGLGSFMLLFIGSFETKPKPAKDDEDDDDE